MNNDQITQKVIRIIREILDTEEEICPQNSLVDDYGINSLESLKIITEIENIFQIKMTGEMLFKLDTVQDLIDIIGQLRG